MNPPLTLTLRGFDAAACTDLDALLGRAPTRGRVGLALSGGGTRAAVSALGVLRALDAWGLLRHVRAISAVSGAAWTAVPYTFLPPRFDEATWLGPHVDDPRALGGDLRVEPGDGLHPFTCLGMTSPAMAAKALGGHPVGIDGHALWIRLIGQETLAPWDLATFDATHRPTSFFAADAAEVAALRAACPDLPETAHVPRPGRPLLMVHTALRVTGADGRDTLAPAWITPRFAGVVGHDIGAVDGMPVGGGGIQSVGFGGRWVGGSFERPNVELRRPLSLADAIGMASSFYADTLADRGIDVINPRVDYFGPRWRPPAGRAVQAIDAGSVECTGVAPLLALDGIDAVIAAVNPPTRIERCGGDLVVDRQLAALFGYRAHDEATGWRLYSEPGGGNPDYAHSQVFAADELAPLLEAFAACHAAGDAPAVAATHTVVDNPRFGVTGGREVRVVWVLLGESPVWARALRPLVRAARGPFFPNVPTAFNGMPPPVARLLSHYAGWMLGRRREAIESLFTPG